MGVNQKPLVSIVVPIYNVEQYLEECFESIVRQTYESIEIILVDDGATDSSGVIADKLAAGRKDTIVIHKKNGGLSDARNAGMKKANGEYITFVDSDDAIDKDFVKNLIDNALDNGADIVQCDNVRTLDRLGRGSGETTVLSGEDSFMELMKFKTVSPTAWGKLYRTSLFTDSQLEFPVGRIHEDTAVLYKLIYFSKKVAYVDKILYYYRMNENSIMTADYTKKHYSSVVKYHQELDDFIKVNDITIDDKIIFKHKALRLLSVLNKMALKNNESTEDYQALKVEYLAYAHDARDAICMAGSILVRMPGLFRGISRATPSIRKILGKS